MSTTTKLTGTVSFAAFNVAVAKTLSYILKPKDISEPTIFHALPFYFFIAEIYKNIVGRYISCVFVCIEKCLDFINHYALLISAIYGKTLIGSALQLLEVGILSNFQNCFFH